MILDNVKTLQIIPTIDIDGVELKALKLAFTVPEPSVNYMPNPSVEVNTNGYVSKVAPARDNTVPAAFGRYALKFTPLDTNYTQIMAVPLPDRINDLRLDPANNPLLGNYGTVSFDIFGQPGEVVTASIEDAFVLDFFNNKTAGALNIQSDDRGISYNWFASSNWSVSGNRVVATALTNATFFNAPTFPFGATNNLEGIYEADVSGVFTSGAIGAWPVLTIGINNATPTWVGVRLEQGLARLLFYNGGAETSIATGAFTFVTGTAYHVTITTTISGNTNLVSVSINNTPVITNATVSNAQSSAVFPGAAGAWLTVVGAPAGPSNVTFDNMHFTSPLRVYASKSVTLTNNYQRVSLTFDTSLFSTFAWRPILMLRKNKPYTFNSFWADAFQYELKDHSTTYFDGDFGGTWDGVPNQSSSSRAANDEGGRIIGLNELFCKVTNVQGGGIPPLLNRSISLSSSGGEIYQDTVSQKRLKNIVCMVNGDNAQDLARKMKAIENCFTPDALTGAGKNTKLLYQIVDPVSGTPRSQLLQTSVKYRAGLEGAQSNEFQQKFALQLEAFQTPDITEYYPEAVSLSNPAGSINAAAFPNVRINNVWKQIGLGGAVQTVYIDRRGVIWVGYQNGTNYQLNNYDTMYLNASTNTGATPHVNAFLHTPDNYFYMAGIFTVAGGTSLVNFARSLPYGVFTQAGPATWNGEIYCLAALPDGRILVGGNFTLPFAYLCVYDPVTNTCAAIVPGLNASVRDIAVLPDGSGFYFTGGFTTATAVATLNRIAFYNLKTSTLSALATTAGNGLNLAGRALAFGANNKLYIGGTFTTAGGMTIGFIAAWNGYTFEAVGASNNSLDADVYDLAYNPADGMLYAVGNFLNTQTRVLTPGIAKFNGSIWLPVDFVSLPGTSINLTSVAVNSSYLTFGGVNFGTATPGSFPATSDIITYTGTAGTNPKIILDNSTGTTACRIFQLFNASTGKTLYFDYNLAIAETLVIDIEPNGVKVTSNNAVDKNSAILPGSDIKSFGFQIGKNQLMLTTGSRHANFNAYIYYQNKHWSFNGGVY